MASEILLDQAGIAEVLRSPTGGVAKDLVRRALLVRAEVVRTLHEPGHGVRYGNHTASAPGESPATDTGRLASSITNGLGEDFAGLFAVVGTNVVYAPFLELGTTRMAPRPFLRPSIAAAAR